MSPSRLRSRRRQDHGFKWARVTMAILATIGLIDTGSTTLSKWGWIGPLTCPGSIEGCEKVLNSAWGTLTIGSALSVPLSLLGFSSYLIILIMAILPLLNGINDKNRDFSRLTWWGLFFTSCAMATFSVVLMGIMIFKIEAMCFFCLLSAFISISLLALTVIGGGWEDPGKLIFRGLLISLSVLLLGLIWAKAVDPNRAINSSQNKGLPPLVQSISNSSKTSLAKHLKSTGAVMYSAYWCPHCHDQKELFGKSAASELLIIECSKDGLNSQSDLCLEKEISGYPSWEINGIIESGVKSLKELADLSSYQGEIQF